MSKTLYEKRGRRYYPVAERDALDGIPAGWWLVRVEPGLRSSRRILEPAIAECEAAMRIAEDDMIKAMLKRCEVTGHQTKHMQSEHQKKKYLKAWEAWKAIVGDVPMYFEGVSMHDVVDAGIEALRARLKKDREKNDAA